MAPKDRPRAGPRLKECVYTAFARCEGGDAKCSGGNSADLKQCTNSARLVHPFCAITWGLYEGDEVHCAASGCSTYNEENSREATQQELERLATEREREREREEADVTPAAAEAQATAAASAGEAPEVAAPAVVAAAAASGEDAGAAALGVQAALPGVMPAPTQSPSGPRPDGLYTCDAPNCKRSAEDAVAVVLRPCSKCGITQLCTACSSGLAAPVLNELNSQSEQPVCPGCFHMVVIGEAFWAELDDDVRKVNLEAASQQAGLMQVMRTTRFEATSLAGAAPGVNVHGAAEAVGDGVADKAAEVPSPSSKQRPPDGTLIWHVRSTRLGLVQGPTDDGSKFNVVWMPSADGFTCVYDQDTVSETFAVDADTWVALRDSPLKVTSSRRKVRAVPLGNASTISETDTRR